MIINLIDISKTSDIKEIIEKFRMKLNINDDEYKNKAWERCAEIMAEDEEKSINFIKENYDCNPQDDSDYRWYISELIEPYFKKIQSKVFIMELWNFFKNVDDKNKKYDYTRRLESIIYENDWEEEPWV